MRAVAGFGIHTWTKRLSIFAGPSSSCRSLPASLVAKTTSENVALAGASAASRGR